MGILNAIGLNLSDASLIEESLRSPQAFSRIFDRHFAAIHGFLARRVGVDAADDLAADTFVVAFERRATFLSSAVSARPWLLGIASNLLRNQWRAEQRAGDTIAEITDLERKRGALSAGDSAAAELETEDVLRAIGRLDSDQRDALLLWAWEGLSYHEIADSLGLQLGTVRSRISRGRQQLRDLLDIPQPAVSDHSEGSESARG